MSDYIKVRAPDHPRADKDGMVFEHDLIMEKSVGRYLTEDESVHHVNQIRDDNRLHNLTLMMNDKDHEYIHKHIKKRKCIETNRRLCIDTI